jgi:hypothetical protein
VGVILVLARQVMRLILGFEPQWLMVKRTDSSTGGLVLFDNMRGFPVDGSDLYLYANSSDAEGVG